MLELGQILKGVDAFQLARVNQTHEEIADVRAVRRLEEERVFSVENRFLQASFDDGMPPARLCRVSQASGRIERISSRRVVADAA